jgi:hypothetical protein
MRFYSTHFKNGLFQVQTSRWQPDVLVLTVDSICRSLCTCKLVTDMLCDKEVAASRCLCVRAGSMASPLQHDEQ